MPFRSLKAAAHVKWRLPGELAQRVAQVVRPWVLRVAHRLVVHRVLELLAAQVVRPWVLRVARPLVVHRVLELLAA